MYELTLLERIQALESPGDVYGEENLVDIEMASIMTHLKKLLNTNKGSVQIDPDYGMPDMTVFSGSGLDETMERIKQSILAVVKKYEKRLSQVKIHMEPDKTDVLTIHFNLEAVLTRHDTVPVFFRSLVKPGGRITIKK